MILVDTCILVDVTADHEAWRDWSLAQLATWSTRGPLLVNPIIFAEWCTDFATFEQAELARMQFGLEWRELPRSSLFVASQAHRQYRRRGGVRPMVLPDFLIGAHAAVERLPLLTRDRRRFETYFNGLEIVCPESN